MVFSIGLIVTSAILNFRMGYRSADTEFDGWVYGLAVGMGDGLKALSPFVAAWGWRHRDYLATFAAALVFTVFTAYSFTAALGFAADHRASKATAALGIMEKHADLRHQLDRDEKRLNELGPQRSAREVEEAITAELNKPVSRWTVAKVSGNCTLNRISTRAACARIAELQQEVARANEAAALNKEEGELRRALGALPGGTVQSADPQTDALERVAKAVDVRVDRKTIGSFLAFLLALFIEFGSGMGLYVATTPWRSRGGEGTDGGVEGVKAGARMTRPAVVLKPETAAVDAYALDRLEPDDGSEVTLQDVFADYQVWCRWRGQAPMSRKSFGRAFGELARAAGMGRGLGNRYRRVRLIGRGSA